MKAILKTLVRDYEWIHVSLGLFGNLCFFVGSVLFLPALEQWKLTGVWLFIVGSFFMLVGAAGRALIDLWEAD
ncbi:MAG: YrhK family protein [Candidatus Wenzhouxiangella sp. M2_3B_020]